MAAIADLDVLNGTLYALGLVLAIHFIGEYLAKRRVIVENIEQWESLGAGIFVAGFFLEILPNLKESEANLGEWAYLIFLVATVCIHVIEKELFKRANNEKIERMQSAHQEESSEHPRDLTTFFDAGALVVHGFLIGAILPHMCTKYAFGAFYFLVSFIVHWFTVAACADHIDSKLRSPQMHLLRDLSPLIGSMIGFELLHFAAAYDILLTILMGLITYIMVRDFLPRSHRGNTKYFTIGVIIIIAIFFIDLNLSMELFT